MGVNVQVPASALRAELRDFYEDYAVALDEQQLRRWTEFFTEDALYRVMARETWTQGLTHATIYCAGIGMIRDRAASLTECSVFEPRTLRHFISGPRVLSDSDAEVEARANFLVTEALYDSDPYVLMVGEYVDRIVRTPAGLRLRERTAVYDNYRIRTTLIFPV